MYFNGMMSIKILLVLFIAWSMSLSTHSNENDLYLNEEVDEVHLSSGKKDLDGYIGEVDEDQKDVFVDKQSNDSYDVKDVDGEDIFFTQNKSNDLDGVKVSDREKIVDFGTGIAGKNLNNSTYLEYSNKDIFKDIAKSGKSNLSIVYISDEYSYSDPNNLFEKTYNSTEKKAKSKRGGFLHVGSEKYFYKGFFNFSYGMNFGIGYSQGKGSFKSSQSLSDATFRLYTIPVDLVLSMELPVGKYFNLVGSAGPSVAGLWQNRSDLDKGDSLTNKRQVGTGFFYSGKLRVSLSNMFKSLGYSMFSDYQVTNMYLNLEARYHNYSNFQDPITIEGTSFGAGFSFDYF